MTKRVKSVVVGSFVLALCAGTLMGVGVARLSDRPAVEPRSQLATELQLTPEQQSKMEAIWSDAMQSTGPSFMDRRRALQEERDAAIAELLPPALLAGYDKIIDKYRASMDALNQERAKAIEDAEARTQEILSGEQRAKYLEIMKRREAGPRGGRGGFDGGRRGRPTTAPVRDALEHDKPAPAHAGHE
jgi:Spy/CpxP family protein refolding chaperone